MKVLVACEESQAVCKAFRALGHEAYSCDIQECSGGHPEWHIKGDALSLINGNCTFQTCDTHTHTQVGPWDLLIAHPPCTHLCSAGQHWFTRGIKDPKLREDAVVFFMAFVHANCEKIAIENPVGIISTRYRKPDQIIQPWQFGHPHTKSTCLWLKGLPCIIPTNVLEKPAGGWENQDFKNGKYTGFRNVDENGKVIAWNDPRCAKIRSKTYPGIARAMAEQWGCLETEVNNDKQT